MRKKEKRDFYALSRFSNKYEAVNVISKEARRLNAIEPIFRQWPSDMKVTLLALQRVGQGLIEPIFKKEEEKKK